MVEKLKYRWDFIGLSTDEKPTPETSEKVVDGSTYYCSDTSKLFVWYKNQWYEKKSTGGGGEIVEDWGRLTYYQYHQEWAVQSSDNCSVSITNQSKLIEYAGTATTLDFQWSQFSEETGEESEEGFWGYWSEEGPVSIPAEEMLSTTGISATVTEKEMGFANFSVRLSDVPDKELPTVTLDVANANEYNSLHGVNRQYLTVSGVQVPKEVIKSFTFGTTPNYTPIYFLAFTSVESISDIPQSYYSIEGGFLMNCLQFNSSFSLGNVHVVATSFMSYCTSFNQNITIPSTVESLGTGFLYCCNNMTSTITAETLSINPDSTSTTLSTTSSTAPAYVNGIKLTGRGASAWKRVFPDRTQSPYRKLIVV